MEEFIDIKPVNGEMIRVLLDGQVHTIPGGPSGHRIEREAWQHANNLKLTFPDSIVTVRFPDYEVEMPAKSGHYFYSQQAGITGSAAATELIDSALAFHSTEEVGNYTNLDLIAHPIYRIDMSAQDYSTRMEVGATHTYEATGAWDGGACARITPPTGDGGYSSVCHKDNLHQGGNLAIRQLNLRFEWFAGDTWASNSDTADCKFLIAHAGPTNVAGATHRPMSNLIQPGGAGDVVGLAIGASTVKQFNPNPPPDAYSQETYPNDFFFGDTAGTYQSVPVIGAGEWFTFELFLSGIPIAGYPQGRMAIRVTRRGGEILTTVSIPWDYGGWSAVDYITEIQVLGGYYNAPGNPSDIDNYFKIAGVTYAANQTDFLGPRAGF